MKKALLTATATAALCLSGLSTANAAPGLNCKKAAGSTGWLSVTDPARVSMDEVEYNDSVKGIQRVLVGKISTFCLDGKTKKFPPKMKWKGKTCDLSVVTAAKGNVLHKLLCK